MGGKDERIKRPTGREVVDAPEPEPTGEPRQLRDMIRRPHIAVSPAQTLTYEDTDRMPKDIAESVKRWCKRNLRANEKIHRDDLWRAVKLTPVERERWNNSLVHMRTGKDALIHMGGGFWAKVGTLGNITHERLVRAPASVPSGPKHVGRLIIGGESIPFINKDGFEVSPNGEVTGLRIVVPHTAGSEPLTLMDEYLEKARNAELGYKTPAVYEVIAESFSPSSRRPGATRRVKSERVNRTRLLGMWVMSKEMSPVDSTTKYVVVYDKAEKI